MSTVIKVDNLSKQYRLGLVGASTIKEDAQRWWAKMRGKEDPFLNLGVENDRTLNDDSKFVWSLKDINFDVKQGDVLGVIGRNGAGKSTLLKILSKVTAPTTGSVKVKGRIASLLEVGTGFHPELTGRENIYLNGAILGMRKHEISSKLDEIIAFAGVEKYVDTPVKRYSSGMYVRLAFAVAAHLESEILIIDEVLAVGDAEFQKKCLGKIGDLSNNLGRTVIFVSHNLQSVSNLCNRVIFLKNGLIKEDSSVDKVIPLYYNSFNYVNLSEVSLNDRGKRTSLAVTFIEFRGVKAEKENWEFNFDEEIEFYFKLKTTQNIKGGFSLYFALTDPITHTTITNYKKRLIDFDCSIFEEFSFKVILPAFLIRPGQYGLYFAIFNNDYTISYDVIDQNVNLPVLKVNSTTHDVHFNEGYFSINPMVQKIN